MQKADCFALRQIMPAVWLCGLAAAGKGGDVLPKVTKAPTSPLVRRDRGSRRLPILDTLRGFALVSMVGYHLCYNLDDIFGVFLPWYHTTGAWIWQLFTSGAFLLLAGMCTHLSGKPLRRALRTGIAALGITCVTLVFMPDRHILFGILHCIAACQLIFMAAERFFRGVRPRLGLLLCVLLYIVTFGLARGYLFFGPFSVPLPQWYGSAGMFVLGFPSASFYSADYFPLLPNIFVFLAGHYLGYALPHLPQRIKAWSIPPLDFLGRRSMMVYLLHQPILLGILQVILR